MADNKRYYYCFNPCFGGSYIMTPKIHPTQKPIPLCFNPCFGGSYIMTDRDREGPHHHLKVSILVLVDLIL